MTPQETRIAFMGTPEFATPALQALIDAGYQVVAVYSQPPRPKGRGHKLQKGPVHELAEEYNIPVFTPTSLKSEDAQAEFQALNLDLAVVAAYGLLLPKVILDSPLKGCINIHGSLLPRWRGAAPIHRAILAGDQTTGITIMQMDVGLDTGPMILKKEIAIPSEITTSELHDQMAALGAEALIEALPGYMEGSLKPTPQPDQGVTYAHKIEKSEGLLNFTESAEDFMRKVRALSPWPGVWFELDGKRIKVIQAEMESGSLGPIGSVLDDKLSIQTGSGILRPLKVQGEGSSVMETEAFLRGHPIPKGTQL